MPSTEQMLEIFNSTDAAKAVGDYISHRQRHKGDTALTRVVAVLNAKGHRVTMLEVETVFRHMDALGLGRMIYRSDGNRIVKIFKWEVNPVLIGKMILKAAPEVSSQSPPSTRVETHRVTLILDSKYKVELSSVEDAAAMLRLIH